MGYNYRHRNHHKQLQAVLNFLRVETWMESGIPMCLDAEVGLLLSR